MSSPIITANWQVDQDQWILPLGGGVGRLFRIGAQQLNASLQAYANVLKPEGFGDFTVGAPLQFLIPKGAR